MLTSAKLFQLLNESIVLLLGALLILLAVSGRVGLPTRPAALIAVGIVFLYWGARAWTRRGPAAPQWSSKIRAGSLALVGALILGVPVLPVRPESHAVQAPSSSLEVNELAWSHISKPSIDILRSCQSVRFPIISLAYLGSLVRLN